MGRMDDDAGYEQWARRFALLGDPGRLQLLLALHRESGVRVSDLAARTGMSQSSTSHALRLLRTSGWVSASRDGRSIRYELVDDVVHDMLHLVGADHPAGSHVHPAGGGAAGA